MRGICNLCKKYKELQKECHVIPEFFYRESKLYHEHHNLITIDLRTFLEKGEVKVISYNQKIGEFDRYKLCPDCDGRVLNSYETYSRDFFYATSLPEGKRLAIINEKGYMECMNADYKKLKLLFLSILWRASISDREIFFEIKLQAENKEELRRMILNGEPKKDTEYPVFILNTFFDEKISNDFLIQPIRMRFANEDGYAFLFGGMIIIFTFRINEIPAKILKYRLQENGIFRTINISSGKTWKLISNWYKNNE